MPPGVRHEGRRSLLNFLGCTLGVAGSLPLDQAMRVLLPLSGHERVTVIGRTERLDMLGAVFLNAVAGNLLDYDDTHLRTVIHPAAPVAPVALALAEARQRSGADMLHAMILGMEVACRLGNAVSPGHYDRGWHITSTCGVFGAAAAAARLLRLDATQTAHALGLAASQSAGLVENLPSAAKNVSVGNAARNGLFAALLAEQGYEAAPKAIEGALGWARAMGDTPDLEEITGGLNDRWEIAANTYKPYPAGIVMHAVIDACLHLRAEHRLQPADLSEVSVAGDQLLLDRGDRLVANARDARVSIQHCAAVSFQFGRAGLQEFSDETVWEQRVVTLRSLIRVELDPSLPRGAARVAVRTRDGRSFAHTVHHAKGSERFPLSDSELEAKLRSLMQQGASACDANDVIERAWAVDDAQSTIPLMRALAHDPAS